MNCFDEELEGLYVNVKLT